jgi:hypothetical protein
MDVKPTGGERSGAAERPQESGAAAPGRGGGAVASYVGIGCRRAGLHEIIGSGGKCNGRIGQRLGERGPAIDLPHSDLS